MADKILTQEYLHELFEYRDGILYRKSNGKKAGGLDARGYLRTRPRGNKMLNHRIIFMMFHGYLPKEIDHIDGNPLNNHIENLRESTTQQNQYNRKIGVNNTSGVKGVSWNKYKKRWWARTTKNGKRVHVGFYKTIEEALDGIKFFRTQHHGEFARYE